MEKILFVRPFAVPVIKTMSEHWRELKPLVLTRKITQWTLWVFVRRLTPERRKSAPLYRLYYANTWLSVCSGLQCIKQPCVFCMLAEVAWWGVCDAVPAALCKSDTGAGAYQQRPQRVSDWCTAVLSRGALCRRLIMTLHFVGLFFCHLALIVVRSGRDPAYSGPICWDLL